MKFEKPSHIKIYKMLTLLKTRDTTFIELIKNLRINSDLSEYFLQIFLIQKFAKELKEDPKDEEKNEIYLINKKLLNPKKEGKIIENPQKVTKILDEIFMESYSKKNNSNNKNNNKKEKDEIIDISSIIKE